jgi:Holliday junction resolvase RusA-like endonuclease
MRTEEVLRLERGGTMTVIIPIRLPGMNEIIAAAKSHHMAYATMKRKNTDDILWLIKRMPKHDTADIIIAWYEPNMRRDIDNISAGQKFILDALVKAGVIKDDSQKYVKSIRHEFYIDKDNPRIELSIFESEAAQ